MEKRGGARGWTAGIFGAIAIALGGSAARGAPAEPAAWGGEHARAPAEGGGCGEPGQPPCPLQGWMRANVAAPLASNDTKALANGLERAARLSPDGAWSSWASFAEAGAAAARKGDLVGARASCKGCHDAWREAYKKKFRLRPIPR
jgi:hypothetical protein